MVRLTLHGHVDVWNNYCKKLLFILKIKAVNGDPDGHSGEWTACASSRKLGKVTKVHLTGCVFNIY